MIIVFSKEVFIQQNSAKLASIFRLLIDSHHFIDKNHLYSEGNKSIFETELFKDDLAKNERMNWGGIILQKSSKITKSHKSFLTKIHIGTTFNDISIDDLLKILQNPSRLILENKLNDKKFLKGVCEKYTNHPTRGNIYKLIKKRFEDESLEAINDGIGEIKKTAQSYIESSNIYKNIAKHKLMVLFDSDKANKDASIGSTQTSIIKYLKNQEELSFTSYEITDRIIWHMLYKMKLENYVPLDVIFESIHSLTDEKKNSITMLSDDELDFFVFTSANIGLGDSKIKDQFPEMFERNFSYIKLEEKCAHHKINFTTNMNEVITISEIEEILLKIAKII